MEKRNNHKSELKILFFILLAFAIYVYIDFLNSNKKQEEKKTPRFEEFIEISDT
jgi:hypothetical protein